MDIDSIHKICSCFPAVTYEIKWKSDLVFSVGAKIFCIIDLEGAPTAVSFKVARDNFEEISGKPYFRPAPYFGRYDWVMIDDASKANMKSWESFLRQSYNLVVQKLSPTKKKQLGL